MQKDKKRKPSKHSIELIVKNYYSVNAEVNNQKYGMKAVQKKWDLSKEDFENMVKPSTDG